MENRGYAPYTKTTETDALGLTIVTERGYDETQGTLYDDITYMHGNRSVRIHRFPNADRPNRIYHDRDRAWAEYYENGVKTGPRRSYNIVDNATVKAVRWVMGLESDAKAIEARRSASMEAARNVNGMLHGIPAPIRRHVEFHAKSVGLKLDGTDCAGTVEAFLDAYLAKAQSNGLIAGMERQLDQEREMGAWMDAHPGCEPEETPGWKDFRTEDRRLAGLRMECETAADGSLGRERP